MLQSWKTKNKKNGGSGQQSRAKTMLRSRARGLQQGCEKVCAPGWGILVKDGADTDSGRLGKVWQDWREYVGAGEMKRRLEGGKAKDW